MLTFRSLVPSLITLLTAIGLSMLSLVPAVRALFADGGSSTLYALVILLIVAYGISRRAPTFLHPFVWASLFGMALQIPLATLMENTASFTTLLELLAAYILFAGGLSVPVKNFKKYFAPIATLSFIGTALSVLLFSYVLGSLTMYFEIAVPILSLIILAAILASIDPTAVQRAVERLHFTRPFVRDIALAEGALNDVVGVIVARFLIIASMSVTGVYGASTSAIGFSHILTRSVLSAVALELVWGLLVGMLGYFILKTWGETAGSIHWSDLALFTIIPLFCFALGSIVGSAGFMAAFVAGLLYEVHTKTQSVRDFFDALINDFGKPVVFLLLGAIVPLGLLLDLLPLGVTAALIFMLGIRPLVVYLSLLPWTWQQTRLLSWRELLFLSLVRETGAIAAILLLIAVSSGIAASGVVLCVGVWVILLTLIIEPPLTPLLAEQLQVAE